MKNPFRLIVILIAIITVSCQKQNGYVITGNLTGFPDSTMIYLRNLSTDETFDSTMIIGNKFQLKSELKDVPEEIWLNAKVNNEFIYTNLLIGNDKINVNADINDFPWNVKITGSKTQDDLNYLRDLTKSFDMQRDSLVKSYFNLSSENQEKEGKEIWEKIHSIDDTTHKLRIEFVKSHINTYPGIINLGYLKNSLPKDTVQSLYDKLSDELKSSKYAKVIEIFLNEKISKIGDTYHDFVAFNKDGDSVRFSILIGKYILLDFTAAYCGPCIQSAEELRMIDKTYSDSLEIVSFSGDSKKDIWLSSLKRDSVSWLSLWDGKGRYSDTYIKYGIQGVPSFFLIDPKGKIIDMWGGYGKGSLENKLKRFKNN
jgi:thiol-disulfide isomerase/thioredoxin